MNLAFIIYIIGIVDSITGFLSFTCFIYIIIACMAIPLSTCHEESDFIKYFKRNAFEIITIPLILGMLAIFIPSSKTLAAMYFIPAIAENTQIKNISKNSINILEEYTKQYLNDLIDKTKPKKD